MIRIIHGTVKWFNRIIERYCWSTYEVFGDVYDEAIRGKFFNHIDYCLQLNS